MPSRKLKIIMTPVGSSGDVLPYVGIGSALRGRGHDVVVVAAEPFRGVIEQAGLGFSSRMTIEEFDELSKHEDLWHPRRGVAFLLGIAAKKMRSLYECLAGLYEPGCSVLVGHPLSFSTRVFEEKHRAPAVTLVLAPSAYRTIYQVAVGSPGSDLSRLPKPVARAMWWLIDRVFLDPHIEKLLNRWRQELGLPKVSRIFQGWISSPQRSIGLFPDWFGPVQPDWPQATRLAGFPMFDGSPQRGLDDELEQFLGAGDPPIVFTPGSANRQADRFFIAAVGAAQRLKRPALLLSKYPDQVPSPLPKGVLHREYAPLSGVLGRCAGIVHHGGIGTLARGLAAGIPQLVMPMGFDQPDNATRLQRLGVGAWVVPKRFTADRVAEALRVLLESSKVEAACRACAQRIDPQQAIERACDLIEQAGGGGTGQGPSGKR